MENEKSCFFELKTSLGTFHGIVVSEKDDLIVIKLENGYQVSIKRSEIISMEKKNAPEKKIKEIKTSEKKEDKNLPLISILHTGGTIASKVDYETGAVKAQFKPEELLEMVPELSKIARIKSRLVRNMMSDDMRFAHYNLIASEIKKEIESGTDGIIITQGTDTLHYTSAALSFILDGLSIPVIIVGSQRSSDRGSSDATHNLLAAAYFISHSDFSGVAICMHNSMEDGTCAILPPCKTRKMHSSRRDAFKPINSAEIAIVDYANGKVQFSSSLRGKKDETLNLMPINPELKIAFIKSHPNMSASEVACFAGFDGIVLEGTGLGHMPISKTDEFTEENAKIFSEIEKLSKKSIVAMSAQTIFGRIDMNVYSPGRKLIEAGVLGNYSDMTPETTLIKLAWLLSNFTGEDIIKKNLLLKNFRGELSERIEDRFI
jgi:glutamyl-tRNA(Gln) amidotransferase subunit D